MSETAKVALIVGGCICTAIAIAYVIWRLR